ncbi:MAG: DUF2334 domain-containing protein [Candidatus Aenigmatarchaeota archaeon]
MLTRREFLKDASIGALGLLIGNNISKTHARENKHMTIEIQDLNPRFWSPELDYIRKTDEVLDDLDIDVREYFIIPAHEYPSYVDEIDSGFLKPSDINSDLLDNIDETTVQSLDEYPKFTKYMRDNYVGEFKIGQHGYNHWPMNYVGEGYEYSDLNKEETEELNSKGKELIEKTLGVMPDRFIFPNWKYSLPAFYQSLDDFGLVFDQSSITKRYEDHDKKVDSPIFSPARNLTWEPYSVSGRKEQTDKILSKNPNIFRLVINVQDSRFDSFPDLMNYVVKRAREEGYRETYSDDILI